MPNPTGTDPTGIEAEAVAALLEVVKSASSPEIAQAQAMLLRRLALEGDVVAARVPAPHNISEIGGYINLLTTLQQPQMLLQLLAGVLGVAGPAVQAFAQPSVTALSWVIFPNDRPASDAQPASPLSISIRSDFADGLRSALKDLHGKGCQVPLLTPTPGLAQMPTSDSTLDMLGVIGRRLSVVPTAALSNPDKDFIALARRQVGPFEVAARSVSPAVPADNWTAVQCDANTCRATGAPATGRQYVPIGPSLAMAGFYAATPSSNLPANAADAQWAQFVNTTGLVAGVTRLGDELSLLYDGSAIASSVFARRVAWVWNGESFAGA